MDRLNLSSKSTVLVLISLFCACAVRTVPVKFVYLKDVFQNTTESPTEDQANDFERFLYLSLQSEDLINAKFPGFLQERYNDLDEFIISDANTITIDLDRSYSSIEEFVVNAPWGTWDNLSHKLGIKDAKSDLMPRICVYEKKGLFEFLSNNEVKVFAIELFRNSQLRIGLAYMIVQ